MTLYNITFKTSERVVMTAKNITASQVQHKRKMFYKIKAHQTGLFMEITKA